MADQQTKQLFSFYKGYARQQNAKDMTPDKIKYLYDDNGNLIDKKLDITIEMKTYRATTAVEIDEIEKARKDAIAAAEAKYEEEIRILRQLVDDNASDVEIFNQNESVKVADEALQSVRFADKELSKGQSYEIRQFLFENRYEKRMFQDIKLPIFIPFDLSNLYTREGEPEPLAEVEQPAPVLKKKIKTLLFENISDLVGFLTLQYPSIITIGDYTYKNAYQAAMAQMAQFYGDNDNFEKIMASENPDEIAYGPEQAGKQPEEWNAQYEIVLMDINEKKFEQNPQLADLLVMTRRAKLGAIIPGDNIFGVGVAIGTPQAKDYTKWPGQNKLGLILENVRTLINNRRTAEAIAVAPDAIEEQVAPVEEVVITAPAAEVAIQAQPVVAAAPEAAQPKRKLRFIPPTN